MNRRLGYYIRLNCFERPAKPTSTDYRSNTGDPKPYSYPIYSGKAMTNLSTIPYMRNPM